ncbi:tRNA (cytosine(38)-C(5))-methyltransferase, partial [Cucurbita argyrosperma subsp. argyrosperma]
MENVGFETSDTHTKMVDILEKADFSRQEFILSPMHFGVPYSRPRYFCLAKRRLLSFQRQSYNNQLLWRPSPLLENDAISYYRYVKGTGSPLSPFKAEMVDKAHSLKEGTLRYCTPREVANLHSFPEDSQFPQHIGLRQ